MNICKPVSLVAIALLILSAGSQRLAAQDSPPAAVIAISGYDELMGDIDFIGSLADQPGASQQLEMMVNMFTQGQGVVGLDKSKTLGVILQAGGPMGFGGAVCIPVSDLGEFLNGLAAFNVQSADKGDGMFEVSANGQMLYSKEQGGWATIAPMPDMLGSLPADPGGAITELSENYDIGARIHVQSIPEAFRRQLFDYFSSATNQNVRQEAGESDADFANRKETIEAQLKQAQQRIDEMDEVTVGIAIDGQEQRVFMDVEYTAIPGSDLANTLAANADVRTNYAGFFQPDSAMMASFAQNVDPVSMAQVDQQLDAARKQAHRAVDDEEQIASDESKQLMKDAIDDFLDAFAATLRGGTMDGGAVMMLEPDGLTFVAGGLMLDTAKVEEGLKKVAQVSDDEKLGMPPISWNAESYGDMSFHTLSHPTGDDEAAQQLFGDKVDIAIGIGDKSVMFAAGRNWLAAVKKVIEGSQAEPNKSVPLAEVTVSLAPIFDAMAALGDEDKRDMLRSIADMLANNASGRDKVKMIAKAVPNGAQTRIELEEGVLRAIGAGIKEGQRQQQRAGAGF